MHIEKNRVPQEIEYKIESEIPDNVIWYSNDFINYFFYRVQPANPFHAMQQWLFRGYAGIKHMINDEEITDEIIDKTKLIFLDLYQSIHFDFNLMGQYLTTKKKYQHRLCIFLNLIKILKLK
jgi:hypothetical protein